MFCDTSCAVVDCSLSMKLRTHNKTLRYFFYALSLYLRGELITWTYPQLAPADEIDRKPYACAGQ